MSVIRNIVIQFFRALRENTVLTAIVHPIGIFLPNHRKKGKTVDILQHAISLVHHHECLIDH